jgi:hypothetical protein
VTGRFVLLQPAEILASVYDVSGRRIAVLANREFPAGEWSLQWDATTSARGVYFCCLSIGGRRLVQRVVLLK